MEQITPIRLLLVDDEEDFRHTTRTTLERRGFTVSEAESGEAALRLLEEQQQQPADERSQIVVLDLKMPGIDGIETLQRLRQIDPELPVIVLTGHGSFQDAYAGIKLAIVDFLQKPVDIERLAARVRLLLWRDREPRPLRERSIAELMVSPSLYPKLYIDQPCEVAFATLTDLFFRPQPNHLDGDGIRSALVFDRQEHFVGQVRFNDLLKLVLPPALAGSPYSSYFTGMFLAQCKVIAKRRFADILGERVTVDLYAPLMEAVHLMVEHRVISLPVMDGNTLVGVLRDRAVILEITKNLTSLA